MLLDNPTLLLSLMLISAMMALSLAVVSRRDEHEGLRKWAGAMMLEALVWLLIGLRGHIPEVLAYLLPNVLLAVAQAVKLAAIHEYRKLDWPRWQCILPAMLAVPVFMAISPGDMRTRVICGSVLYGIQLALIAFALHRDIQSREGRAWHLLFYATAVMVAMLALRAVVAMFNIWQFAPLHGSIQPNPAQMAVFVSLMALNLLGAMGFILMIKERTDREIRSLAMTDPLTKLFNRRAFLNQAEKEIATAERTALPLAMVMIDIDHFKRINDTKGHTAGDKVLTATADLLASLVRKQDTLARFGGEEFCLLLPATDEAGAQALAEKLRSAVATTLVRLDAASISLTISLGITVRLGETDHLEFAQMLDDADRALYLAKNGGRNRTVIHTSANLQSITATKRQTQYASGS